MSKQPADEGPRNRDIDRANELIDLGALPPDVVVDWPDWPDWPGDDDDEGGGAIWII